VYCSDECKQCDQERHKHLCSEYKDTPPSHTYKHFSNWEFETNKHYQEEFYKRMRLPENIELQAQWKQKYAAEYDLHNINNISSDEAPHSTTSSYAANRSSSTSSGEPPMLIKGIAFTIFMVFLALIIGMFMWIGKWIYEQATGGSSSSSSSGGSIFDTL